MGYPARDAALRWGKDPDHPGQTLDDVLQEAACATPRRCRSCNSRSTSSFAAATAGR